jgi:hypothetical protein
MGWRLFLRLTLVIKYRRSNKKMLLIHWNELAKLNDKWVIDCCLTQNEQVFSYITLRTASIQLYHVENSKYSAISRWKQQVFSYITLRTASIQLYHAENSKYSAISRWEQQVFSQRDIAEYLLFSAWYSWILAVLNVI